MYDLQSNGTQRFTCRKQTGHYYGDEKKAKCGKYTYKELAWNGGRWSCRKKHNKKKWKDGVLDCKSYGNDYTIGSEALKSKNSGGFVCFKKKYKYDYKKPSFQ